MFDAKTTVSDARHRSRKLASLALIAMIALTGCSSGGSGEEDSSAAGSAAISQVEAGAFPVTVKHAFGETTIAEEPKRVMTMDSESTDTALALGVVPSSIAAQPWGGDADGYFPWTRRALEPLVGEVPKTERFTSETGELEFEYILAQEPDVILAPYSGFSEEEYERLSKIAPTIPYDDKPWQPSSWQAMTTSIGASLGRPGRAAELISEAEDTIAETKEAHPRFQGVNFIYGTYLREGETQTAIYGPADPRVKFIEGLGLTVAPDVIASAEKSDSDSFMFGVSLEELDAIDADVYIGWASEQSEVDYTLKNQLFTSWPVIEAGKDLWITDKALSSATQRVSVLSIPWGMDELVPQLTEVLDRP